MLRRLTEADTDAAGDSPYVQRFSVTVEYPVYFTSDIFDPGNPALVNAVARCEPQSQHRLLFVMDSGLVGRQPWLPERAEGYVGLHGGRLVLAGPVALLPGGEGVKNHSRPIIRLQKRLLDLHLDRHSCIVAVGGGALLDMVGYVAATVHRGIRMVRVPSTVLAQDDSGVGVKNGVNAFGIKNFLGVFAPPFAVINDFSLLASLDARDRVAGMAEAVKVALIRDPAFFAWLEGAADRLAAFEAGPVSHLIRRCAELHMRHIGRGGDPFEMGSARPLDFGHWAAHKLEMMTGHALRHGEAVAIGIALDCRYSVLRGLLAAGEDERVLTLLRRLGFRLWHPMLARRQRDGRLCVLDGIEEFRQHLGGGLTITMLAEIGRGFEVHEIDAAIIERAIDWLERWDSGR